MKTVMDKRTFSVPGTQSADEAGLMGVYLINGNICLCLQNYDSKSWNFSFWHRDTGETIAAGHMEDLGFGIKEVIEDAAAAAGLSVREYQKVGRQEGFGTPGMPA